MDTRPTPPALLDGLDSALRDKYLAGICTPAERQAVEAWIVGDPKRRTALAGLRRGLGVPRYPALMSVAELKTRLNATIGVGGVGENSVNGFAGPRRQSVARRHAVVLGKHALRHTMRTALVWSGTFVALVIVSVLWSHGIDAWYSGTARVVRYSTHAGQQANITLQNGIRVTLAPQTTLIIAGVTGTLVGEAYFQIAHRTDVPFTVRTNRVLTRVLGTAFAVRRYPDDSVTRVSVIEGKVMTGASRVAVVTGHTSVQVSDSTVIPLNDEDVGGTMDWTTGKLVFHKAPVSDVLAALGRWYGIAFHLGDPALGTRHLTTTLDIHRGRAETLAAIASGLSVRMVEVGDTITLLRQYPARPSAPSRTGIDTTLSPILELGK